MLPSRQNTEKLHRTDDLGIRAGSWWRYTPADGDESFKDYAAPKRGIVLMVRETFVIDGELHSLALHPHPTWMHAPSRFRFLLEDFLKNFAPETEGERIRAEELDEVMGRVALLTQEASAQPPETFMIEAMNKADKEDKAKESSNDGSSNALANRNVPAVLLPGGDVVATQQKMETRVAQLQARQAWIKRKTDEISQEMKVVANFQTEMVEVTLASISEETARAQTLLEHVQTIRLFLGEDIKVHELRTGQSADPSEPLTFMQRMLFLDEEIYIQNLTQGFTGDHFDDLGALLQADFGLVQRLMPSPRSVVITRARRNTRPINVEGMDLTQILSALEQAEKDKLVQIFVRDGERVHMIIADDVTSKATRLFPSETEISALFRKRAGYRGGEIEITPQDIDYSKARNDHDKRALLYKRFLLILWGIHERSDVFGDFLSKGANWLSETVHSERFRFIHDEENVLTDGRPSIFDFIHSHNRKAVAGSRIVADWVNLATPSSAPRLCRWRGDRIEWQNYTLVNNISSAVLKADDNWLKGSVEIEAWGKKPSRTWIGVVRSRTSQETSKEAPYKMSMEGRGWLCLDKIEISDLDYYIESREARKHYLEYLHVFHHARMLLKADAAQADALHLLVERKFPDLSDRSVFTQALRLWRSAHGWTWPQKTAEHKALARIAARLLSASSIIAAARKIKGVVSCGITAKGNIFVDDISHPISLHDDVVLPWIHRSIYPSPTLEKLKGEETVLLFAPDPSGELTLWQDTAALDEFYNRTAPEIEVTTGIVQKETRRIRQWATPSGLFNPANGPVLSGLGTSDAFVEDIMGWLEGRDLESLRRLMHKTFDTYKTVERRMVCLPIYQQPLGIAYTSGDPKNPARCHAVGVEVDPPLLAWHLGFKDEVQRRVESRYLHPERRINRYENANLARGLKLMAEPISCSTDLAALFAPGPRVLYQDHTSTFWSARRARIGYISWQDQLAASLAPSRHAESNKPDFAMESFESYRDHLHVLAAERSQELLERVAQRWAENLSNQS